MRTNNSQLFVPVSGRIYGFNLQANMAEIEKNISVRHSAFGFKKGYTLEDFGIDTFKTTNQITTIDELVEIYRNNTECYKKIEELMNDKVDTRDEMVVLNYVFNSLFTIPFDTEFYRLKDGTLANNFIDILSNKNFTLYSFYLDIMREKDPEVRKDNIRQILNDIVDTLEYYIGTDDLRYIFSFVPTTSPDAIVKYINLMINFFKSWKTHFLDPIVTYSLDDKKSDRVYANGDMITEFKTSKWYSDNGSIRDSISIKSLHWFEDRDASANSEVIDMYGYHQVLSTEDEVYDGEYANNSTRLMMRSLLSIDDSEINGGEVDSLTKNPYIMVNAGVVSNRKEVYDLDGGGAINMKDYLTVDGLKVNSPGMNYPLLNDFSTPFYVIEGGTVGISYTKSNEIQTIINKRTINNDVIISTYDSNAIKDKNGLYLGGDFASGSEFRELRRLLHNDRTELETRLNEYIDNVKLSGNIDILTQNIQSNLSSRFAISKQVLEDYHNNITYNYLNSYVNNKVFELRNWFIDLNLFGWEYF